MRPTNEVVGFRGGVVGVTGSSISRLGGDDGTLSKETALEAVMMILGVSWIDSEGGWEGSGVMDDDDDVEDEGGR